MMMMIDDDDDDGDDDDDASGWAKMIWVRVMISLAVLRLGISFFGLSKAA